jgi:ectoine hydroxylase-related dioxygenase (phytanoyl-CoA dioxygenase family)
MNLPKAPSYGVREQTSAGDTVERAKEEILQLGYAVVPSGYSVEAVQQLGATFDATHRRYVDTHGRDLLRAIDELNGIRMPFALDQRFLELATNPTVLALVRGLLQNDFILNQQNGIINPPGERYNQAAWHRDLPYQHFVSSRPLAVNALYCIDDFTDQNGATFVLPSSHTRESYPSEAFIARHAKQIVAPAGSFIVLHAMLFHRGGSNTTSSARRAVNHLYTARFIRQQIDISAALGGATPGSAAVSDLLGFKDALPRSVKEYLEARRRRTPGA